MKPIKFKVWDKEKKRMIWPNGQGLKKSGVVSTEENVLISADGTLFFEWDHSLDSGSELEAVEDYEKDRYVVLFFTGVLDQDNEEIYCGDIREYHDVQKGIGVVKFHEGRYLLFPITNSEGDMNPWVLGNIWTKKIGTIYENPELLKVD